MRFFEYQSAEEDLKRFYFCRWSQFELVSQLNIQFSPCGFHQKILSCFQKINAIIETKIYFKLIELLQIKDKRRLFKIFSKNAWTRSRDFLRQVFNLPDGRIVENTGKFSDKYSSNLRKKIDLSLDNSSICFFFNFYRPQVELIVL